MSETASSIIEKSKRLVALHVKSEKQRELLEDLPQGHGSGLDADMVDGLHASEIVAKGQAAGGGGGGGGGMEQHGNEYHSPDMALQSDFQTHGENASAHHTKTTSKAEITDFIHGNESHSLTFEDQANKGQANGYCEVDASVKVPAARMPVATVKTTLSFAVVGTLVVGLDKAPTLLAPCSLTIVKVKLVVKTAPSGSAIIVDVNKNGTTIFTTQGNRPQIADGQTSGDSGTPDVTGLSEGDKLTVDIDQVGSGTAGADLTVELVCEQTVVFS